jgi:RecA-family ATPase
MLVGGALQSLANQFRVSILVVHHTRKSEADDPLDTVSGTTGITGAADAVMILKRGRGQADGTLSLAGRDISEQELALKFRPEEGAWELMGDAAEYAKSQERLEIIKILREHGPKTPKEIAEALGKKQNNTRALMWKMAKDQEIKALDGKRYDFLER